MKKIFIITIAIATLGVSCKKDFFDLNENPNFPESVPVAKLLPVAIQKSAALYVDPNMDMTNVWMGNWSFSNGYSIPAERRNYTYPNSSNQSGFFTNAYNAGYDFQTIINLSIKQKNPAYEGMARIMKSMIMQMLVDVYNDVPYTEAFKATDNQTPKYDNAMAIYEALYDDINKGIVLINAAQPTDFPGAAQDIMFQGDKTKWVKFANTLKLKLLIRQSTRADRATYISNKVAADFGTTGLASFLQVGESAFINPGYVNATNQQSPYWLNYGYNISGVIGAGSNLDFFRGGRYASQLFAQQNDFRLAVLMDWAQFAADNGTTSWQLPKVNGLPVDDTYVDSIYSTVLSSAQLDFLFTTTEMGKAPVALPGTALPTKFSLIANNLAGTDIRAATEDALILGDFESLFLQAEAVERGWFPTGNSEQLFTDGKAQSFIWDFDNPRVFGTGAGAAIQGDIMPNEDNDWASATDKIKLIITQKYMAMGAFNLLEPWTEYRRTGFPNVDKSTASDAKTIPFRYLYPQREYDVNGTSVKAVGAINQFTNKVWWMQ